MDKYGIDPDHGELTYLDEGPLATTSQYEILTYPDTRRGADGEDDCF